jgi:hypothetical protein
LETDFLGSIPNNELGKLKLIPGNEHKCWFHQYQLQRILNDVRRDYLVLEVNGESQQPYTTAYYDTPGNEMYLMHHNGCSERCKIRRRSNLATGQDFLEIKHTTNKGRTVKKRIRATHGSHFFSRKEADFIQANVKFRSEDLKHVLHDRFNRIVLVSKNGKERCSIDMNLISKTATNVVSFENLVIMRIKADRDNPMSTLARTLRDYHIASAGFSKYCMGRTLLDQGLKHNAFKAKVRQIERIITS